LRRHGWRIYLREAELAVNFFLINAKRVDCCSNLDAQSLCAGLTH
jgi:hypothetical protein